MHEIMIANRLCSLDDEVKALGQRITGLHAVIDLRFAALHALIEKGFATMSIDLDAVNAQLNTITNNLADDTSSIKSELSSLKSELASALAAGTPPTQAQIDTLSTNLSKLSSAETVLRGLGADPSNPVPTATPAPTDPPPAAAPTTPTTPTT